MHEEVSKGDMVTIIAERTTTVKRKRGRQPNPASPSAATGSSSHDGILGRIRVACASNWGPQRCREQDDAGGRPWMAQLPARNEHNST